MAGRVEVEGKPDLLWETPQLERFYHRLFEEYELRDHHRSSLRVECYIVILIVAEIVIMVAAMFLLS